MTTKEFKANIKYLEDNGVSVSNDSTWESLPHSRELHLIPHQAAISAFVWKNYHARKCWIISIVSI